MNSNVKLSWAGFSAKSPQTLRDILQDKDFTDVTMATEDGAQILAHQVILSSGSAFFKRILRTSKIHQQRPLLFLSGLKGSLVTALVDFIYLGECSVNEEDLDQFFKTGKEFGLQGIEEVALEDGYNEDEHGGAIEKENNVEETLSPSLLDIDDDRNEILTEEHPLKLEIETLSNDGTFPEDVLDMLDNHIQDSHGKNKSFENQSEENLISENATLVVENQERILEASPEGEVVGPYDLLDAVSDEDNDDGAVINPFWNLSTMTGILPSEIVSDDLLENLDELTTQINPVQRNSVSDELLDLEIDDLLRDVEENVNVANTRYGKQKANIEKSNLIGDIVNAKNTPRGFVSNRSLKVDVKNLHFGDHDGASSKSYCDLCKFSTNRMHHLKQHKAEKHEGREYSCNMCGFQAAYSSQLSRHKAEKHKVRKFECKSCDYTTSRRDNMRSHRCRLIKQEEFLYRVNVGKSDREAYYNFKI